MNDAEEEPPKKSLTIFGTDVSQVPCFRDSFLYGVSGGLGVGCLAFLGTSRTHLSTHIGFGAFCLGTFSYWFVCRYQWSKRRLAMQQIQAGMKKQTLYEGTEVEAEFLKSV